MALTTRVFYSMVAAVFAGFLGGVLTVSVLAARVAHANDAARPVQASRFALVDGNGQKRGEWAVDKSGRPSLRMFDEAGRIVWDTDVRAYPLTR